VVVPFLDALANPSKLTAMMLLRFAPGNALKGILTVPDRVDTG
jgi:hypothetical protein